MMPDAKPYNVAKHMQGWDVQNPGTGAEWTLKW
jgi:hypothetical protein